MARPHGRARVDANHPRSFGVSDRTGMWWNLGDLVEQFYWSGTQLVGTGILVHPSELDVPNQQLRTIVLGPDPAPQPNSRTENFTIDEA